MNIPDWLKGTLKEMVPELIAEYFGIQSIKKLLNKGKEKADEKTKEAAGAKEGEGKTTDIKIKHEGIFNLSDETSYIDLVGKVENCPDGKGKKYMGKVSTLINSFPYDWQRRRFRASVGNLNVDIDLTKEAIEENNQKQKTAGFVRTTKKINKNGVATKNLGVQFLISFAQYEPTEMMEICKASGVLDSPFENIKKWAEKQGPDLVKSINKLTEKIKESSPKNPKTKKEYPGFFRAFLGLKKKENQKCKI